ncbi:MAG: adenosylcobinamide-GDP ribazoletransferase [Abditibacteriota bacterium]|nr:adenosylcobinamide-GDP ribazoletransferase [Abditibacteriota bacterium]
MTRKILYSLITAFSLWTKIPVPQIPWKQENMAFALPFFALVGAVVGAVLLGVYHACLYLGVSPVFRGVLLALVPAAVTGGIHMDGFCDTADALASRRDRETRLRIMKDPHAGAFAVIALVCLMLFYAGALGELKQSGIYLCALGFALSRSVCGAALILFPAATPNGMGALIKQGADRQISLFALLAAIVACLAAAAFISPAAEGAAALVFTALLIWLRVTTDKAFGGMTGDTAGFFITLSEAALAAAALFV